MLLSLLGLLLLTRECEHVADELRKDDIDDGRVLSAASIFLECAAVAADEDGEVLVGEHRVLYRHAVTGLARIGVVGQLRDGRGVSQCRRAAQ